MAINKDMNKPILIARNRTRKAIPKYSPSSTVWNVSKSNYPKAA